jgi:hypothetical protein
MEIRGKGLFKKWAAGISPPGGARRMRTVLLLMPAGGGAQATRADSVASRNPFFKDGLFSSPLYCEQSSFASFPGKWC